MFSRLSGNKFLVVLIGALFYCTAVNAQLIKKFTFKPLPGRVRNSLYNSIKVLDIRRDTTNLGMVQTGFFNKKTKVVAAAPLQTQINNCLAALIDKSAKSNELLLQLREFSFAELTMASSETGYCYIRANLFAKTNTSYQKVNTLDTVIEVKSFIDVTKELLDDGSEIMSHFIADNLYREAAGTVGYSYTDLVKIDSLEKLNLKVYNSINYVDGVYKTYKSFSNQTPDARIIVSGDSVQKNNVDTLDKAGKSKRVKLGAVYAIVYKGVPYIATGFDYYPLHRANNDLLFTGKATVQAPIGQMVTAEVFLGVVGSLIASNANATFEMKIDHVNGAFIRLKEIAEHKPPVVERKPFENEY